MTLKSISGVFPVSQFNTGLQSGSIVKGRMEQEKERFPCCSGGAGQVIFKMERIDCEEEFIPSAETFCRTP